MTDHPSNRSRPRAAPLDAGRPGEAVDVLRRGVATGEAAAPDLLVHAYLDSGNWVACAEWLGPLVEQGHVRFAGRLGVALGQLGDVERPEAAPPGRRGRGGRGGQRPGDPAPRPRPAR